MLKKCMLIFAMVLSVGVQAEEQEQEQSHQRLWIGLASATGVIAGTGVYLACRESNEIKIERSEKLYDFYIGNLHGMLARMTTFQDVQQFVLQSVRFKKEMHVFDDLVKNSYREIKARYGSWFKPWNWTLQMKLAYEQIKELQQVMQLIIIMFRYEHCITGWDQCCDETFMVQNVQHVCQGKSMFPLSHFVEMVQQDLKFLRMTHFKIACDVILIDMLERMLAFVLGTSAYITEQQKRSEILLQERQTRAVEQQASAQQQQAQAQSERNRIEREKLDRA